MGRWPQPYELGREADEPIVLVRGDVIQRDMNSQTKRNYAIDVASRPDLALPV